MLDALILAAIAVIVGTLWYFGVGPVIYGTIMVGGAAAALARLSARDQVRVAVSIGVQKGPPIGVQKRPPSLGGVTVTDAPFALVAA